MDYRGIGLGQLRNSSTASVISDLGIGVPELLTSLIRLSGLLHLVLV